VNAISPARAAGALQSADLVVEGMRCAGCIAKIEAGLGAVPGVVAARVNFTAKRVHIDHDDGLSEDGLVAALKRLGFEAHPLAIAPDGAIGRESRTLAKALAVATFAAMNVMLLSVSVWSGAEDTTRDLFHWLSALVALPAIAYSGQPFFKSAWGALRHGRTNMDVPISIGVLLTAAMSLHETATGGHHAYFDGAVMLLAFLLGGRLLDTIMREKAQDAVAALLRRLPEDVALLGDDGAIRRVPLAEVVPGMRILVAAGERLPVDGVVDQGDSNIDRSLVTGESVPETVEAGSAVLAGTLNLRAPLVIRATAGMEDTVIADIARLMEAAGQGKSRYVRIADRASRLYAPAVHSLAALSFAGWLIAGAGVHEALLIAVAVLIITCPCALGLAVPVAQVVASGALMRRGVLVRDGAALEKLAVIDTVLLDKTGTVTQGRLEPIDGMPTEPGERRVLLALAASSRHPIARAIAEALERDGVIAAPVSYTGETAGQGVEATAEGRSARLGRADWVGAEVPADDSEVGTCFRLGDGAVHRIRLADRARSDAGEAIPRLRSQGLQLQFVSGDGWSVVERVARPLGLFARARMSPADKFAAVEVLERAGHRVLMVGDGLNDGPALKRASVGMAPSAASDVGRQAADLVFFGELLTPVPIAIDAARRTMRVVRQNFILAIGYNVLAVPLAIAGMVTPLVAALAMSGSSILVVANALRLRSAAR
jgi:Cu2+-exporting ATPase